jgi:DNA-directed RNA polymerase specialized sigma24 family protein
MNGKGELRMPYSKFDESQAEALNPEAGYTIDRAIYDSVSELAAPLSETELGMLANQLSLSLERYERLALDKVEVRDHLYRMYNSLLESGKTVSTLSREFNMSRKGHNDTIRHTVQTAFKHAYQAELLGSPTLPQYHLGNVKLRSALLLSEEVKALIGPPAYREAIRIDQFRQVLFKSVAQMAAGIARRQTRQLSGTVIDLPDLVHEAFAAVLTVLDNYQPIEDGKTLTSFIYTSVNGIVSSRIRESTRNVAIPRTVLDRWGPVHKKFRAYGLSGRDIYDEDGIEPEIFSAVIRDLNKAMTDSSRLYTGDEVLSLIKQTQEEASLDVIVAYDEHGCEATLGSLLLDQEPTVEEKMDARLAGVRLMALIREFCSDEEYIMMELRWGMGSVKSYQKVSMEYTSSTGRPMNKTSASIIERRVFEKIRKRAAVDPSVRKRFTAIWETLTFAEKSDTFSSGEME